MTAKQYQLARRKRGSKEEVACKLGVHITAIDRRERGDIVVTQEAEMALLSLPELDKPVVDRKPGRPATNK